MWTVVLITLMALAISLLVWLLARQRRPAGPRGEAEVPATVRHGPRSDAGAVALEEPDSSDPPDIIGR